jgi:hypothetical protein
LKSLKRFLFPKVANAVKFKHRSKKSKWKEKYPPRLTMVKSQKDWKGFNQQDKKVIKETKRMRRRWNRCNCYALSRPKDEQLKNSNWRIQEVSKDLCKAQWRFKKQKIHWAEGNSRRNQNKGKDLNGKLSEERWSLFVDAEEKSSWKSCQVERAYQVRFLQRFRVNPERRLGLANENSFKKCGPL